VVIKIINFYYGCSIQIGKFWDRCGTTRFPRLKGRAPLARRQVRLLKPTVDSTVRRRFAPPALPYRLDGKVALLTGAGRGIGAEMALQLARCGAKVVVNYVRSTQSAEKVVQEIKGLGCDSIAIQADVSKVPDTIRLFEDGVKHFGKLDVVCSNSGVVSFGHLEDITEVSLVDIPSQILKSGLAFSRKSLTESSASILVASFSSRNKPTSTSASAGASF
jgi:hypothetical protein